jgi:hypothetical protein
VEVSEPTIACRSVEDHQIKVTPGMEPEKRLWLSRLPAMADTIRLITVELELVSLMKFQVLDSSNTVGSLKEK